MLILSFSLKDFGDFVNSDKCTEYILYPISMKACEGCRDNVIMLVCVTETVIIHVKSFITISILSVRSGAN